LKNLVPVFSKCADRLIEVLDSKTDGSTLDMLELYTETTLDVIGLAAFSYDFQSLFAPNDECRAFKNILDQLRLRFSYYMILPVWAYLHLTPSGRSYRDSIGVLHRAAERIIAKRIDELRNNTTKEEGTKDLLDYMIEACLQEDKDHTKIDLKMLRDEIMVFLFAGHDTTSSAMTWFTACISKNPQYEPALLKEVDELYNATDFKNPSMQDLNNH